MGSLFGKKKEEKKKRLSREARLAARMPPIKPSEDIDPKAVLKASEVDLKGKLPPDAASVVDEHIQAKCRGLLVDPEDEETRIFAVYEDKLVELGRADVEGHDELLRQLKMCVGGAVTVGGARYQMQDFESLSDFGSRLALNFFEEGKYATEEILNRRKENIRLINRLKPATSLTRKNTLDIHQTVLNKARDRDFLDILLEEDVVTAEVVEAARTQEQPLLTVLQNQVLPRKAAASALARYLGVEYLDVESVSFDKRAARLLEKDWALTKQVVPYAKDGDTLRVAMMDPTAEELIDEVAQKTGLEVRAVCSAAQDIMVMIHKAHKLD